jgi:hypothetical protein
MQSLAGISSRMRFQSLASPTLCAKKDMILSKFDALLRKLGSEVYDLASSILMLLVLFSALHNIADILT